MKKRVLALILAAVMLMSLLAACGGKKDAYADEPEGHITLTVGVPQSANISSYTNNDFTQWIEEQLDVTLDFVYYSGNFDEASQQFSLDCAAGKDLPDVVWGIRISNYTLNDLGEDGYVLDLKPYLDTNFPHFQEALAEVPEADKRVALDKGTNPDDGGYYGMPLIALEHVDNLGNMVYINKQWLDKLGLAEPTNIDELYNVLVAFRDKDPNGNGKKDEVPMVGSGTNGSGVTQWLMNAFVYWDAANIYNVTDGKIWSPLVTDEFRQGLSYINKLYKEGLLSEMCYSGSSYTDFVQMNTPADQVAKAGIWFGHPSIYTDSATTILDQYSNLNPLGDATGKGGYNVFHENTVQWISWITAQTDTPKRAMAFLDLMYTDDAMVRMRHGAEGVHWEYGEPGLNIKGKETNIYVYDDSAFFGGTSTWGINGNCIMNDANYTGVQGDNIPGTRAAEIERLMKEMWDEQCEENVRHVPEEVAANLIYTTDDFDRRQEIYSRHWSWYSEQMTLMITGKLDVNDDAVWKTYVDTLYELGQEELIEIAQRAYDREQAES